MTSTGLTLPGTVTTAINGGGSLDWTNPNNVKLDDGSYATCAPDATTTTFTYHLRVTNFGFSVPAGATINGVTFEVQANASNDAVAGNLRLRQSQLVKAGALTGTADTTVSNLTTSDANYTRGSASSLWGATLASTDTNASNFGGDVYFDTTDVVARTISVDYFKLSVDYTAAAGGAMFRQTNLGGTMISGPKQFNPSLSGT